MSRAVVVTVPRSWCCPVGQRHASRASELAQLLPRVKRADVRRLARVVAGVANEFETYGLGEGCSFPSRVMGPNWRGAVAKCHPRAGSKVEHAAIAARFEAAGAL